MIPGEVYRFSYVWSHEAARGEESGRKIRRACLLVKRKDRLFLFPITTKLPEPDPARPGRLFLEIPETEVARAGLDPLQVSYLVLDDFNVVRVDELYDFDRLEPDGVFSPRFLSEAVEQFLREFSLRSENFRHTFR